MISLAVSIITEQVKKNVNQALAENRLGDGGFIEEFENKVANYHKAAYGVVVCNGTMADIVALAAINAAQSDEYPKKCEVIVPALTFIAQVNAIIANGLVPVFVDIDDNFQLDIAQVKDKINEHTLAIMPANLLGKQYDFEALIKVAGKIPILEDNCEAYGVRNNVIASTYSFFPSHTITTGEGGMILTDNKDMATLLRACRNHGRIRRGVLEKFHFYGFGLNGKMSNVIAAIGCGVVDLADQVIEKRKKNVEIYNRLLGKNWYASSPHCYPILKEDYDSRNALLEKLDANGIEARKLFSCLPVKEKCLVSWGHSKGDFPKAEEIGKRGLFVPVHQELSEQDIERVVSLCV